MCITLNHSSSRRELSWCRQTRRTRSQRTRNNNSNSNSSRVTARWTRTTRRRGTSSMRITTMAAGTTTNRGEISNCLWLLSSLVRFSYKILSRKLDSQEAHIVADCKLDPFSGWAGGSFNLDSDWQWPVIVVEMVCGWNATIPHLQSAKPNPHADWSNDDLWGWHKSDEV